GWIAGQRKGFAAENGGGLVMSVSVAGRAGEYQNHHVRPEPPDVIHHVAQDFVAIPLLKSFVRSLGKAEVDGAREILFGSVNPSGREKFLAADYPQFVA